MNQLRNSLYRDAKARTNRSIHWQAFLGIVGILVVVFTASAQPAWLKRRPSGGCCPGCGSVDDPLGPRLHGEPISAAASTVPITLAQVVRGERINAPPVLTKTNSAPSVEDVATNTPPSDTISN